MPSGPGQVVPAVQRDEDGARAARTPLGRRPPLRRGTLLPGIRRLPRRTGESKRGEAMPPFSTLEWTQQKIPKFATTCTYMDGLSLACT